MYGHGKEYDPEQYRDLGQNVMTVSYGLSALYQATDEVLRAYLDSYGYSYASHFEENNVYRIQYLNQLFFYGITIAGILLLYGLILVVWSLFYLQEQKKRIRLLMELGMERSAIIQMKCKTVVWQRCRGPSWQAFCFMQQGQCRADRRLEAYRPRELLRQLPVQDCC